MEGTPSFAGAGIPSVLASIQLPHDNAFTSIWEYVAAISAHDIDFLRVLGTQCPICGQDECWREITPYSRHVIELFPYREGDVLIARFQCRRTLATFSLLPVQLIPYHQYTVRSVLGALLTVWMAIRDEGKGFGWALEQDEGIPSDSRVTAWLLDTWLVAVLMGLRRAHPTLSRWARLEGIRSSRSQLGRLGEVAAYLEALGVRGPPAHGRGITRLLCRYGRETGRLLFGTPSQERV